MIWKVDGELMPSPSSYKDNIEDTDNDSYTSVVDGSLIDNPIAVNRRRGKEDFTTNI